MGGGAILILALSFFLNIEQHVAQATNIIFFIPTSIMAIAVSAKNKLINFKVGNTIIIFGIIGAIVGAKLANITNAKNLKKFFGIFLGIIAIYEILCFVKENILKKKDT